MEKVKIAVVGVGGMGYAHCKTVKSLQETELTGVCDVDEEIAKKRADEFNVKYFIDYKEMIKSGIADAIIVATPHWFHPEISIYAFKNALHVLSEKPIAVTVSDADKMIEASKKSGKTFSIMFQRRTEPIFRKAIEIVKSGILGELIKAICIDPWYRTQAYYDSAKWRATWKGEGGGVLINQAPHTIDLFMLLAGLPKKIFAKTRSKLHDIEVEDEVSALLEYENGAWGYYYTSTCEPVGPFYLEISGNNGKLIIRNFEIKLYKYDNSVIEFTKNSSGMWTGIKFAEETPEIDKNLPSGHIEIIRNFARNILYGEPLIVKGEEGLNSVEFINACILSAKKNKEVQIPINRNQYNRLIKQLIKNSKPKKIEKELRITDPKFSK